MESGLYAEAGAWYGRSEWWKETEMVITIGFGWWLIPAIFSVLMFLLHRKFRAAGFDSDRNGLIASLIAWLIFFIIF